MKLRFLVLIALGVALAPMPFRIFAASPVSPPLRDSPPAVTGLPIPEPTDLGNWAGTYTYVCRDFKMALWIRAKDAGPEIKAEYFNFNSPEVFETDWDGKATYYVAGQPASFRMQLTRRDGNRLEGTWKWDVQLQDSGRSEDGTFAIYRALDGRQLVFRFDKLERMFRTGESARRYLDAPVWTFRKVSKRSDVLWEELPF